MKYFRKLYHYVLSWANHKYATLVLFKVSFIESSFFPIPPDVLLIPLILAKPKKAFFYAFICTIASVLGGVFGYIIGFYLMDSIGYYILDIYNAREAFTNVSNMFHSYGIWAVGIAGLTPIPYKIFTIASGVFSYSLFIFIILSFISRGLRFFALALLLYLYGEKIKIYIEKYFNILTILFMVLLVLGYVLFSYII
jgi:membrane protein YqaA with SNARE-associated domain